MAHFSQELEMLVNRVQVEQSITPQPQNRSDSPKDHARHEFLDLSLHIFEGEFHAPFMLDVQYSNLAFAVIFCYYHPSTRDYSTADE